MRQCRVIIRRLGGLQEREQIVQTDIWGSSLNVVAWDQLLFVGVIAKCALFVKHSSPGRQGRLWNIGGLNLLLSEVCFLFRMESSGTFILRLSLESQLCVPPQQGSEHTCRRGLSPPTTCIHFLVRWFRASYHPLPTSVSSSIGQMNFVDKATLCLDSWYHYLDSWNFLVSGFSLAFTTRISASPHLVYFWPQVIMFVHVVIFYFLNVGKLGTSIPRLHMWAIGQIWPAVLFGISRLYLHCGFLMELIANIKNWNILHYNLDFWLFMKNWKIWQPMPRQIF